MKALVALLAFILSLIACFGQDAPPQIPQAVDQSVPPAEEVDPLLAEDIRDIKAELPIPESHSWIRAAVIAAMVVALLAVATWYVRQRRHRPRVVDLLAAALNELQATRELMRADSVEPFATSLSQVLRHYIEARFGARAAHQTTEEFLESLAQNADIPLKEHRVALQSFLKQCDNAKFAGTNLSREEMDQLYQTARTFLEGTNAAAKNVDAPRVSASISPSKPQPLVKA